jgi:hypothetical protein
LSRIVASRSGVQNFVSVLGASNAGKTVYLGLLLDILSKGSNEFRGLPSNAASIELQEQVVTALERRSFPEKTPSESERWKWMHCQLSLPGQRRPGKRQADHDGQQIDLVSPDFAGEAIALEVQRAGMYPAIRHIVKKSVGILVLCDSTRVRDQGATEDLFAMKLASYIAEQHGLSSDLAGRRKPIAGPSVAVVFTKSDQCPDAIEDASSFAANNTPRLYEYCRRTFAHHQYFAVAVAGSSGLLADTNQLRMRVPFHVQPNGIVDPLRWIVSRSSA